MDPITLFSIIKGGLVLGALYALMATGLSLVWTTLGIFNFAHGAFIALGAYVAWQFASADAYGLPLGLALAVTTGVMFAIGAVIHFLLVKPFERRADVVLITVITTLAGSAILENALLLIWGPRSKQIPELVEGTVAVAEFQLAWSEVLLLVVVLAILIGLGLFLRYTRPGRSMRAVSQNREAAQLLGLDVPIYFALAFGLSAVTAGLAGVFVGTIRFMNPAMGAEPLMKALIVVIFGGIARFSSPIYAAFIIGLLEAFSIYVFGLYWAPAVLFLTMIVVLLIKPEGLFGKYQRTL
ncbi:branched-chain amino acid ABC transporter permease [Aestuariivita boseongensis]|uniref:branched-chain amino acid ABC transporter permease n=1 Tax=Aestuariivita boseongensis TaxID=1470562 RepID=UPI001C111136|nr:branched-chain amino acid ABC transporter permease [Aestuariivita boseongensis]